MPYAESQGARIYYEEAGSGTPILFIHEFGGDYRSWQDQVRHFGRGWRAISWSARGYPPSDAPEDPKLYGQDFFNRDAIAVLDAAGIGKAHIVGLSMGGYTALMLAARFPERVISCVAAGAGSGALKATRAQFIEESVARAEAFERAGAVDAESYGLSPTRVQLQNKDPAGWRQFVKYLAEHPAHAAAKTLRTVQAGRASLYDLESQLKGIAAPVLLLVGDEDEPCLDVNLWMKRLMPGARLGLLPGSGHAINLEEPELFNQLVEKFIAEVDRGSWRSRDPRATPLRL
ncbi:MAG TPA: alpha/beta hydrolase [Hyphomicrobiaceae bacterium]|jgi:pimeloyl-ACP methyl ester carboxylesterase|nr:alpha/beta hydrolase [Hyphomicrobiaceae bacterium]